MLPMPLILGALCATGFYTGVFPKDMIVTANMIAVGTIAFHVLVVHSGTLIDLSLIRSHWRDALICLTGALLLTPAIALGLRGIVGRELALIAPGCVVGGGASCAIASRFVMDKAPALSVFPWMAFMVQGLFCVPLTTFALKKESGALLSCLRDGRVDAATTASPLPQPEPAALCGRLPAAYKTTAYYLVTVLAVSVCNRYLHALLPEGWRLNLNVTALLLGFAFGRLGLLEKGPLFRSDSYGLLLLGLMGLFANTIANNTAANLLRLLPPLLLVFAVSTAVLAFTGIVMAKIMGCRPWRGIILTMNCMMGFPVNRMLVQNASSIGANETERAFLTAQLSPLLGVGTMLISNAISILMVSISVNLI